MRPDICYRCPSTESLDGALRTELGKSASSLIPTEVEAEFIFTPISTITVPVTHQSGLDTLIEPADFPQSLPVEYALCRQLDGKPRLTIQRAIAKSIVEAIADIDGFRYSERRVHHPKKGGNGARFLYVCNDSTQNPRRKANEKKEKEKQQGNEIDESTNRKQPLATYDCGGTISIGFSIKKDGVNVVYKHNPIHRDVESRLANALSETLAAAAEDVIICQTPIPKASKKATASKPSDGIPRKRGRHKKVVDSVGSANDPNNAGLDTPASAKAPPKKRRKKNVDSVGLADDSNNVGVATLTSPKAPANKRTKKSDTSDLPGTNKPATKKAKAARVSLDSVQVNEPPVPPRLSKGNACNRCRSKKIKCDGAKPTCNQCKRGLRECH